MEETRRKICPCLQVTFTKDGDEVNLDVYYAASQRIEICKVTRVSPTA